MEELRTFEQGGRLLRLAVPDTGGVEARRAGIQPGAEPGAGSGML